MANLPSGNVSTNTHLFVTGVKLTRPPAGNDDQETNEAPTDNDAGQNDRQRQRFEHAYEQLSPYPYPIDGRRL